MNPPADALPPIPQGDAVIEAARAIGLVIPEVCLAGVRANLALLDRHAAIFRVPAPGSDT